MMLYQTDYSRKFPERNNTQDFSCSSPESTSIAVESFPASAVGKSFSTSIGGLRITGEVDDGEWRCTCDVGVEAKG